VVAFRLFTFRAAIPSFNIVATNITPLTLPYYTEYLRQVLFNNGLGLPQFVVNMKNANDTKNPKRFSRYVADSLAITPAIEP